MVAYGSAVHYNKGLWLLRTSEIIDFTFRLTCAPVNLSPGSLATEVDTLYCTTRE